jgi:hypothetical protein
LDIADKQKKGIPNNELLENCAFVNTAYQLDILSLFCVQDTGSDSDIERVSAELDNLYVYIQSNKTCQELMLLAASKLDSIDPKIGLTVLYSFQYMHFMHNIVVAFEQTQTNLEEFGFEQIELLKEMLRNNS